MAVDQYVVNLVKVHGPFFLFVLQSSLLLAHTKGIALLPFTAQLGNNQTGSISFSLTTASAMHCSKHDI